MLTQRQKDRAIGYERALQTTAGALGLRGKKADWLSGAAGVRTGTVGKGRGNPDA